MVLVYTCNVRQSWTESDKTNFQVCSWNGLMASVYHSIGQASIFSLF